MDESVYVIYKDGQRLLPNKNAGTAKAAYLTKGTAKSTIKNMVNQYMYISSLNKLYSTNRDKYNEEMEKELARYEVVEYVPKINNFTY